MSFIFIVSSANGFSLGWFKILSSGKELKHWNGRRRKNLTCRSCRARKMREFVSQKVTEPIEHEINQYQVPPLATVLLSYKPLTHNLDCS